MAKIEKPVTMDQEKLRAVLGKAARQLDARRAEEEHDEDCTCAECGFGAGWKKDGITVI